LNSFILFKVSIDAEKKKNRKTYAYLFDGKKEKSGCVIVPDNNQTTIGNRNKLGYCSYTITT